MPLSDKILFTVLHDPCLQINMQVVDGNTDHLQRIFFNSEYAVLVLACDSHRIPIF